MCVCVFGGVGFEVRLIGENHMVLKLAFSICVLSLSFCLFGFYFNRNVLVRVNYYDETPWPKQSGEEKDYLA